MKRRRKFIAPEITGDLSRLRIENQISQIEEFILAYFSSSALRREEYYNPWLVYRSSRMRKAHRRRVLNFSYVDAIDFLKTKGHFIGRKNVKKKLLYETWSRNFTG
jgi:hypothetical protein